MSRLPTPGGDSSKPYRLGILKLLKPSWMAVILMLCLALAVGGVAKASNYSTGLYGSCSYDCAQSTQVTTPSGLEVDINLHDGQSIPESGYTIIVTPLNGNGSSFKQVDFFIDGGLVHSQQPGQDGTVMWLWSPDQFPGTDIKIIITGQDGQSVTKEFHVTIARSGTNSVVPISPKPAPSFFQQVTAAPGKIIRATERLIHQLPPSVKHALPYFLFLILAADILLVLLHFRREVHESKTLQGILTRERQSGQLKKMLVDLMSHYLRTPLTIISSASELGSTQGLPAPLVASLKADVAELNRKVGGLIAQAQAANTSDVVRADDIKPMGQRRALWRQPFLALPIAVVGIVALSFDYLAGHGSDFTINQINLVVQIVVFGSLATLLYLVTRRLELSRRDAVETRRIIQGEVEFNRRRDTLIDQTAMELSGGLGDLDTHISQLDSSQVSTAIRHGQQQLHEVIEKCVVARQLKGVTNAAAPTPTLLSTLSALTEAQQAKVQAKGLSIDIAQDRSFMVSGPELLSFVIRTILDNAIEYSPPGGHIELTVSQAGGSLKFSVIDHGPGVPEDKRFALFQAFSKAEGTEVFNHQGAGFSLYLDKLIMTYLLGDIAIESVSPQGTKVILTLSLKPQALSDLTGGGSREYTK